jgi:hypothetical protein
MNERIKELLKQATKEIDPYDRVWVFSKVDQAKFAELIVRECIDTVLDSSVEYATRPQIAEELKHHFGVEE